MWQIVYYIASKSVQFCFNRRRYQNVKALSFCLMFRCCCKAVKPPKALYMSRSYSRTHQSAGAGKCKEYQNVWDDGTVWENQNSKQLQNIHSVLLHFIPRNVNWNRNSVTRHNAHGWLFTPCTSNSVNVTTYTSHETWILHLGFFITFLSRMSISWFGDRFVWQAANDNKWQDAWCRTNSMYFCSTVTMGFK